MDYRDAVVKRWRARTDLLWLCNNVLNMNLVTQELNGTMIDRMYKFPKPSTIEEAMEHDKWDRVTGWSYEPLIVDQERLPGKLPDPQRMPGKRRTLLLDSRSTYKTTVNVEAHCVQWILNYPDITIMVFQGSLKLAKKFLTQTKNHFHKNDKLRDLFPELCPPKAAEFGTQMEFTVPGRTDGYMREQATMTATSIEQAGAGQHVEVIKYSDIVNEDNCTDTMVDVITDKFDTSQNLLVSPIYWGDVEGTRYHGQDCYGQVIERERERQQIKRIFRVGNEFIMDQAEAYTRGRAAGVQPEELKNYYIAQPDKREYNVYINSCYAVANPSPTFDYDDMLDPNLKYISQDGTAGTLDQLKRAREAMDDLNLDSDGKLPKSRNPRVPSKALENERRNNKDVFACQKLNNPTGDPDTKKFPVDEHYPRMIPRKLFRQNVRVSYYDVALDTADTTGARSDYSAISVAAIDGGGRRYVVEIRYGKWHEEEIADNVIEVVKKYNPMRLMMEKERGNQGVRVWLRRKQDISGMYLPMVDLPRRGLRGQTDGKKKRISSTLRPWYMAGHLVFLDDLGPAMDHLKRELTGFPKWHDDILDTLTDLFWETQYLGRNSSRPVDSSAFLKDSRDRLQSEQFQKAIGIFDDLEDGGLSKSDSKMDPYFQITGGL